MTNTTTQLSAMFKEVYADALEFLLPKNLILQQDIKFVPTDKQPGGYYHQPVVLKHENGVTYYKGDAASAYALEAASPGIIGDAKLIGAQLVLRSAIDYECAARASSGGKRAFTQATKYVVENMWQSIRKRLEISLLYGQSGLGTVSAVSTNDVTISAATWAPGIWAGLEGASTEAWQAAWAGMRTGTMVIAAVNIESRIISVDAAAASLAATDVMTFKGSTTAGPVQHDMLGIHTALTAAGTVWNVSNSTYSLWKANTYALSSENLSFEAVQKLVARCMAKGGDGDYVLYVSPATWATLISDQAALRRHGDPNRSVQYEMGAEAIKFFTQLGTVAIKASIYVKEGYAYLLSPRRWHRIGATDITFRLPDRGDEFFLHLASNAGYELRCYSNQAVFCEALGTQGYVSGIDNT